MVTLERKHIGYNKEKDEFGITLWLCERGGRYFINFRSIGEIKAYDNYFTAKNEFDYMTDSVLKNLSRDNMKRVCKVMAEGFDFETSFEFIQNNLLKFPREGKNA